MGKVLDKSGRFIRKYVCSECGKELGSDTVEKCGNCGALFQENIEKTTAEKTTKEKTSAYWKSLAYAGVGCFLGSVITGNLIGALVGFLTILILGVLFQKRKEK